jgi:hypothetical protein
MQHHLRDLLFKDGVYDPEETIEAFSQARNRCMEAVEGRAVVACDRSRIWQAAYFHSPFIELLFPRNWNAEFIDAPLITNQHQPSTTSEGMAKILQRATGQYRMLYALLAGCGPLRVGEALGLELGKHFSPDFRTLYIRQKAKRGIIQPHLKTKAGEREVDLCSALATMLHDFVGDRPEGLLFSTSTGGQLLQANTLQDSLHPILKAFEHEKGGFNIFRRFRITHLQKTGCPEALRHFWSGQCTEPRLRALYETGRRT